MRVVLLDDEIRRKSTFRTVVMECQFCGVQACVREPKGLTKCEASRLALTDECASCGKTTMRGRRVAC